MPPVSPSLPNRPGDAPARTPVLLGRAGGRITLGRLGGRGGEDPSPSPLAVWLSITGLHGAGCLLRCNRNIHPAVPSVDTLPLF